MGIIEILSLLATIVPKVISAGQSISEIWSAAHDALSGADKDGNVTPEAMQKLKALVDAQLAELDKNATEAKG